MNFPNLNNLNNEDHTKFALCKSIDKKRKDDKVVYGESSKIIYEGRSKLKNNMSDYVIGVFSKKKREMQFMDIEGIFPISHKIRRIEEHAQRMEDEEQQKLLKEIAEGGDVAERQEKQATYVDNKLQLIRDFGTSKAKKAASGIKAHMVNENNISSVNAVKKMLEDTAVKQNEDVKMNEEQKQQNKISTWKEILPEFDMVTEDKKAIFSLESSKF